MLLDVSNALKNPGQAYPFELSLSLPSMEVLDDPVDFGTVTVSGTFTGAVESVSVKGHVEANVQSRCALCLADVACAVSAELDEVFTREPDPKDPDGRPLQGHSVELSDVVKDALLLELPIRFLCKADCRGLCPVCGVNRNLSDCMCRVSQETNHPFSAFTHLLTENEEV